MFYDFLWHVHHFYHMCFCSFRIGGIWSSKTANMVARAETFLFLVLKLSMF